MIVAAARGLLLLAALVALVVLARRRRPGALAPPPQPIAVLARAQLGPGFGLAVVDAGGRRLLVGWGKDGVRLVGELSCRERAP